MGSLVSLVGIDPASMAAPFVVQGFFWPFFLVSGLYRRWWARYGRVVTAIATLWHLPFGTALSLVQVTDLVRYKNLLRSSS